MALALSREGLLSAFDVFPYLPYTTRGRCHPADTSQKHVRRLRLELPAANVALLSRRRNPSAASSGALPKSEIDREARLMMNLSLTSSECPPQSRLWVEDSQQRLLFRHSPGQGSQLSAYVELVRR